MDRRYTDAGRAFSELIVEVFKLNGRLLAEGDRLVRDIGLSSARWQVLGAIAMAPSAEPVAWLARNMGLSRQGVQRVVTDLVAEGIVQLDDNPHHRRARLVAMTKRGRAIFKRTFALQAPWVNAIASGLNSKDIVAANHTLAALRKRLDRPASMKVAR